MSDFIYSWRQIRKDFLPASICILVLAIGIGSATAVFTILYDAILKPLPYRNAKQLVYVYNEFPRSRVTRTNESGPDFADLTTHHEIFSETAAYYFNDFTMTEAGYAQHVDAVNVSASLFPMLGIPPEIGRTFTTEEDLAGSNVVVLSDGMWRGTFGGDPNVTGRTIGLDEKIYRIIGVMPADFSFPHPATQMWVPLFLSPRRLAPDQRRDKWLRMLARLAPGLDPQRANLTLLNTSHDYATLFPDAYPEREGWHFSCVRMGRQQTEAIQSWLALTFGAVLCVLLIACINASGLLLLRATVRQREWSIRLALGASPARLLRQVFIDTASFVFAGCGLGIASAILGVRLINDFGPVGRAAIGPWTFVFALTVAVGSTLLAGILPAAAILRSPLHQSLKTGDNRTATGQKGWRNLLVSGQIAIAIGLLFTATILSRSFIKLLDVSLGFSAKRIWTASVQLPERGPASRALSPQFFENLTRRISELPGVESASAGVIPFSPDGIWNIDLYFPGQPTQSVQPTAAFNVVLPDYFRTLQIPLLAGRAFSPSDNTAMRAVAIVDTAFAQRYFPGQDPIEKLVANITTKDQPYTIVGLVGSVQGQELDKPPEPEIYVPELQYANSSMYLVVREAAGRDVTRAVRDVLQDLAPNVALFNVDTLSNRVLQSVRLRRFIAWLLSAFAGIGLILAALGLYGLLAYSVELRRREIAIRIALGASIWNARRVFALHSLCIGSAGLCSGLLLGIAISYVTRGLLFGISIFDRWTMVVTLLGFLGLVLLASWIPTARAGHVNALVILKDE